MKPGQTISLLPVGNSSVEPMIAHVRIVADDKLAASVTVRNPPAWFVAILKRDGFEPKTGVNFPMLLMRDPAQGWMDVQTQTRLTITEPTDANPH